MKWSFKIGRVFGIQLRVHITFFLIIAYAAYIWGVTYEGGYGGAVYGSFLITLLFACVVIHELCHSLMAIHFGGEVASITLLPIGGVSLLKNMPEEPRKELWVSVVGPLSNVVIALLLGIVYVALPGKTAISNTEDFTNALTAISAQGFITYMLVINLMLAVFNLLPAFPLDGGRVLRSLLARRMSHVRATRVAVTIGQLFAFGLGLAGLLLGAWLWIVIAVFIYMGAGQEGAGAETKSILSGLRVRQALTGNVRVLAPTDRLSEVVTLMMHLFQEDFPVVEGERLTGVLTRSDLIRGLHDLGPEAQVSQVMTRDFPVVDADALFSEVYQKMNETGVKAVPVLEDGKLLGLVTLEHLSEVFMLITASHRPSPPDAPPAPKWQETPG
ncbi:MAG: site-2 protease family protein [Thermoleophilia bacterium]